jgi:uncharacterized protein (TIGR00297 family)
MDRKLNYLFLFVLVVVFIHAASVPQQWNIVLGVILAAAFSFLAFIFQRLSLDGMFAAIVVGTFVFGLGGWAAAAVIMLFFLTSSIISTPSVGSSEMSSGPRRSGFQVWANGFWIVFCMLLASIFNADIFVIGAMAAIATATADTWSTELGSDAPESTYLINDFQMVPPGTDGGISIKGTVSGLVGSALIAGAVGIAFSLSFSIFLCILIAGFSGCLLDSYFGAIFQRNNRSVILPVLHKEITIDNNLVNMVSTGAGAMLAIIFKLIVP